LYYAPSRDRLPECHPRRLLHGPAALLDYDRCLRGLVLEEGGPNSHVAIVARALGIPLGRIANATGIADPGDAIVDGSTGDVHAAVARCGRAYRARAAAPAGSCNTLRCGTSHA
jgi:phosphotransferase system enzyme I (PtsP)